MYHKKKCKGDPIMENMKRAISAFMALVLVLVLVFWVLFSNRLTLTAVHPQLLNQIQHAHNKAAGKGTNKAM